MIPLKTFQSEPRQGLASPSHPVMSEPQFAFPRAGLHNIQATCTLQKLFCGPQDFYQL